MSLPFLLCGIAKAADASAWACETLTAVPWANGAWPASGSQCVVACVKAIGT